MFFQAKPKIAFEIPSGFGGSIPITEDMKYRHIGIAGGTGGGKSTLMKSLLVQARYLGHAAVLNDPKGEFFEEFYRPGIDWVIDIGSEDGAAFALERECRNEAEGTAWAKALYSGEKGEHKFFLEGSRRIAAYLLGRHNIFTDPSLPATCARFAEWVSNPEEQLAARLAGSDLAATVSKSKEQASGFYGYLASVGPSMRMIQPTGQGLREFCAREWCERRAAGEDPGWVFMTGTKMTQDANMPIHTAIMQMLILGVQTHVSRSMRDVLFLLDEMATSFKRIPDLVEGMATMRSSKACVVLGLHDMAQLIERYGKEGATTIMDQASTMFFFRTNDPDTWNYIERRIGSHEISRLQENMPMHLIDSHNRGRSWTTQITKEAVVMGEQIQRLPIYEAYFAHGGFVVPYRTVVLPKVLRNQRRDRQIPVYKVTSPPAVESVEEYEAEAVPVDEVVEEEEAVPVDDQPPPPAKRTGRKRKEETVNPLQLVMAGIVEEEPDYGEPVPVD